MGMFDVVHIGCPTCGDTLSFQSKGGECRLIEYSSFDAPPSVIGELHGQEQVCNGCGINFKVRVTTSTELVAVSRKKGARPTS